MRYRKIITFSFLIIGAPIFVMENSSLINEKLFQAASNGNVKELLTSLDNGACIEARNSDGNTPLIEATRQGNHLCVDHLIKRGAFINVIGWCGYTPLHWAAACKVDLGCVRALITAGANLNVQDQGGSTPLHVAALVGNAQCIDLLLQAGAQKDILNNQKYTPLHHVANNGFTSCVEKLLDAGAKTKTKNRCNESPFFTARSHNYRDVAQRIKLWPEYVNYVNYIKSCHIAFCMARHDRLGQNSPAHYLPPEIFCKICLFTSPTFDGFLAARNSLMSSRFINRSLAKIYSIGKAPLSKIWS